MIVKYPWTRVLVNTVLAVPALCALYVGALVVERMERYPTEVWNESLVTEQPVHPGQVIEVQFNVIRRKNCVLGISRVMERDDRREFELGFVTQVIDADVPALPRLSGYRITVPAELLPGHYKLFSRFRYYCTGLDLWSPWVRRTDPITVEVSVQ